MKSLKKQSSKNTTSSKGNFIKNHKKLVVFLVLIILILIGILVFFKFFGRFSKRNKRPDFSNQTITTELNKMSIQNSISVTGTLASADIREVSTTLRETEISEVCVSVGDVVNAGDIMVVFDSSDLNYDLETQKLNSSLNNVKNNKNLNDASEKVDDSLENYVRQSAELQQDVNVAYAQWQEAVQKEEAARLAYEKAKTVSTNSIEEIEKKKQEYEKAQEETWSKYANYYGRLNDQTNKNEENVKQIEDAQYNLKITQMEQNINNRSQKKQIQDVEEKLGKIVVTAPISGTVTSVSVEAGDVYDGNTLFVIQDTTHFIVEATVDEYDIPDISKGLAAKIKTDATDDIELNGEVTFVSAIPKTTTVTSAQGGMTSSSSSSGSAAYEIEINLADTNERLRAGMTAKTGIILDARENVFAVAYDSVNEDENGYYVEVVDGFADSETTKKIYVEKGLESDYYVEIISNELSEGMRIKSSVSSSNSDRNEMNPFESEGGFPGGNGDFPGGGPGGGFPGGSGGPGGNGGPGGGPGGF